jgi:hypothetical protein
MWIFNPILLISCRVHESYKKLPTLNDMVPIFLWIWLIYVCYSFFDNPYLILIFFYNTKSIPPLCFWYYSTKSLEIFNNESPFFLGEVSRAFRHNYVLENQTALILKVFHMKILQIILQFICCTYLYTIFSQINH